MAMSLRVLLSTGLLLMSVCLSGCEDSPDPDSSDSGSPDAGLPDAGPVVWDGTYTELEERGDILDTGPFAPCTFDTRDAGATTCEELSRFDLSQCNLGSLSEVEAGSIYLYPLRDARPVPDGGNAVIEVGGVHFTEDGGNMFYVPLPLRDTGPGRFFVRGFAPASTAAITLAGCEQKETDIITGCFAYCYRARLIRSGTFEAHRVSRWGGEPESSGGLELLSEGYTPLGHPLDLYVTKGHAYVVSIPKQVRTGGLSIFDVSNPRAPVLKKTLSLPGDNTWNGVWAKGDALYIASNTSGTLVYDISQPAEPLFIRGLTTGGTGTHTVLVDGDRLYSMAPGTGTFVHDISEPLSPRLLTVIALPDAALLGGPHDTFVYENRLYVSDAFRGYFVVDVTDLDHVRELGGYVRPDFTFAHHSAVGTFAGRTIAFEGGEFQYAHLRVLDVTRPERIVKIGEFRTHRPFTSIHNLLLRDNLLYIAWYQDGVRVLDVSNPTRPRQVAHYNTFREADPYRTESPFEGLLGIRVPGDGYVYAADSSRGLLIFNELAQP
ncbi:LVIVD repeat-containing protein [Myxococcus sp. CA039A]|uniref:LVIVD repeat-containing protein n=1 Tax=Myxococcus sp. CA039A TaxID=2741737 RepID=UPI00157A3BDB|nr:hypothetical protein [Myxococcus sp. CA039A]NTX49728.1 hypothetical protein [Myxococcus sp. CA039A]